MIIIIIRRRIKSGARSVFCFKFNSNQCVSFLNSNNSFCSFWLLITKFYPFNIQISSLSSHFFFSEEKRSPFGFRFSFPPKILQLTTVIFSSMKGLVFVLLQFQVDTCGNSWLIIEWGCASNHSVLPAAVSTKSLKKKPKQQQLREAETFIGIYNLRPKTVWFLVFLKSVHLEFFLMFADFPVSIFSFGLRMFWSDCKLGCWQYRHFENTHIFSTWLSLLGVRVRLFN